MQTFRRLGESLVLGACTLALSGHTEWVPASGATAPESNLHRLWTDDDAPVVADSGPDQPVEVGVKWMSAEPGTVTALRFYKGAGNTGPHMGHLWTEGGQLLAWAVFRNETASGWQTAPLSEPVAVGPGSSYVASYHTSTGHYSADAGYFAAARLRGPLHAPEDSLIPNGVFAYGPPGTFPAGSYNASNYWVDVVLETGRHRAPVGAAARVPAAGAAGLPPDRSVDGCPCTLLGSAVPGTIDSGPDDAAELGVRFTSIAEGVITGMRFYKSAANTGTHVARLWSPDGTLLTSARFKAETASGWQEVAFAAPVPVQPNAIYTASYSTKTGHYSFTSGGLAEGVVAGPLRAIADGDRGGNGVFRYGSPLMPTSSFRAANYWVDVIFVQRRP
jgi:hypothetical protein